MSGKHSLLYFDIRGRAACIRMMFNYVGVEFEDRRIQFNEWPDVRTNVQEVPLGFLPVLTTPCGTKITQTIAIIQYVADMLGLFGSNKVERGVITCVLTSLKELQDQAANIVVFTKDEAEKEKQRPAHDKSINQFFGYFELLRKENSDSQFLVGKTMTAADMLFIDVVDSIEASMPGKTYLENYPSLKKLNSDVREDEKIKQHLSERK